LEAAVAERFALAQQQLLRICIGSIASQQRRHQRGELRQTSRSWVTSGAPWSAAAPIPTTRKGTPRRWRAWKSARSARVSAKSSTAERLTETGGRSELETAEGVIDVAGVDVRMRARNRPRAGPQGFGMDRPLPLLAGQVVRALIHDVDLTAWRACVIGWTCPLRP